MCDCQCSKNNQDNGGGFVFGLILGIIVGAVIAIILYRQNKTEVLDFLKKKFNEFIPASKPTPTRSTPRKQEVIVPDDIPVVDITPPPVAKHPKPRTFKK